MRVEANPSSQALDPFHFSYNSRGQDNFVTHEATGKYSVLFGGLDVAGGTAHVMSIFYGRSCQVVGWYPTPEGERVRVLCFTMTGAPVDTPFMADFSNGSTSGGTFSFLYSDQPSGSGVHVPDPTYTFDSTGAGPPTVQRLSAGTYAVSIPATRGFAVEPRESYQVTAVGTEPRHCRIMRSVVVETTRFVMCTDVDGRPADARFTLSYALGADLIGRTTGGFAYAAVADPSIRDGDVPLFHSVLGPLATVNVRRAGVGYYILHVPSLLSNGGLVMIGADSVLPRYCDSYGWGPWRALPPGDEGIGVFCYDPATDRLADSAFVFGYTQG